MRLRLASLAFLLTSGVSAAAMAAEPLVDAAWLDANLAAEGVVILDIRSTADPDVDVFAQGHIPGAVHSDYGRAGWRATVNEIPGMLPPVDWLETLIGNLGIDNDDHIVIVSEGQSTSDFGAAARVYWTFNVLGHDEVSILEGGYAGWVEAGLAVEEGAATVGAPAQFTATFRPELVASRADVRAAIEAGGTPLVDARPAEQYRGEAIPGNVGVAGTIPGAVNLPHDAAVLEGREIISRATLDQYLEQLGIASAGDQIAFCNTGHWASVGWFLLSEVGGNDQARLYDGSMVDWVAAAQPVETGATATIVQR